jgi:hypothetical protein
MTCRWFPGGADRIPSVGRWSWTSGSRTSISRCTTLLENSVWWWKVQHTIKAGVALPDTNKHGYTNSFLDSDAQFYLICNQLVVFLSDSDTWWPGVHRLPSMVYGPQGPGDVWRLLQPGRPARGVQQPKHPHPHQWLHIGGKVDVWARLRSEHSEHWCRARHEGGRRYTGACGLATASSTVPLFPLSPRSEHGARVACHTPTAECFIAQGRSTRGYSCFTHHKLIFTHIN